MYLYSYMYFKFYMLSQCRGVFFGFFFATRVNDNVCQLTTKQCEEVFQHETPEAHVRHNCLGAAAAEGGTYIQYNTIQYTIQQHREGRMAMHIDSHHLA